MYTYYLKSVGIGVVVFGVMLNAIGVTCGVCSNFWLQYWAKDKTSVGDDSAINRKQNIYLGVYIAFSLGYCMSNTFTLHQKVIFAC